MEQVGSTLQISDWRSLSAEKLEKLRVPLLRAVAEILLEVVDRGCVASTPSHAGNAKKEPLGFL